MKLHLYYCPGTCSFVPHTLLELLKNNFGIEYEATAVSLKDGQQHTPEYKAVNPRQQVPALLVNGQLLTQVIAITNFLNDSYPQASILPKDAMAKAQALSTLAWINNTVHPTFTRVFRPERFGTEEGQAGVKQKALDTFKGYLGEINEMLADNRPYLCGQQLTPADIYAICLIRWGGVAGVNPADYPRYQSYVNRISQEEPIAGTMALEKIDLNTYKG